MRDKWFYNKITWFSFVFSLLVIWIHSYNAELYLGKSLEMEAVYRLEHRIGDGLGQIAVPGFFMISGYLFYRNFAWSRLGEKWNRRIRSVLIPYILWNFLYYMGYVIGSRLPWMTDIVGKGVVPFDLFTAVDAVINYTYNYVFWYLYQLLLLILLAPVLYLILKCFWSRLLFLIALWWMVAAKKQLPFVNADALIYYSSAASLALSKRQWVEPAENGNGYKTDTKKEKCRQMFWGAGMIAGAYAAYQIGMRAAFVPCFVLCHLLAAAGLWMAVSAEGLPEAKDFMRHNFFLYGVHFALVRFINKAGAQVFPAVWAVPLILYLLMPLLVLGIASFLGRGLRRRMPLVWSLMNGGRI